MCAGGPKHISTCTHERYGIVERWKKRGARFTTIKKKNQDENRWHQTKFLKSKSDNNHCTLLLHTSFACEKGVSSFVSSK
jgi:hypothetical protein